VPARVADWCQREVAMGRAMMAVTAAVPLTVGGTALTVQVLDPGRVPLVAGIAVLLAGSAVLLRPLAGRAGVDRVAAAGAAGLLVPAGAVAWATARLLDAPPAARLAWMLGEEDNAHVVGVARELLADGRGGAELAAQYGTSFASPGIGMLRSGLAGPLAGDPRLDAVTATTASAVLLPIVVAAAILMSATALRAAGSLGDERSPLSTTAWALVGSSIAGTAVQLQVVALPLQLGFATLAWAVAWVLVGWAAMMGLLVTGLPRGTRLALWAQVAASAILLEGSWPFLIGALALPVLAVGTAMLARRRRDATSPRRVGRPVMLGLLAAAGAVAALLTTSGAIRTVLGFGREALTAGVEVGSSIVTVGPSLLAGAAGATALAIAGLRRDRLTAAVVAAPAAGALATLAAVWAVALVVADGIVGYGGSKVLLAAVLLAVCAAAAVLAAGRVPRTGGPIAAIVLALVIADPLGRVATGWWQRTAPSEPPHAVATVTALEGSSPGLPIRCRPMPGTPATASARLAAYFCIVWMEDAFNEGPDSGDRFAFFQTEDPTFDRVLAEADAAGLYGFAYPLRLGPGWFGWDGAS
jgi:hypothetical protein